METGLSVPFPFLDFAIKAPSFEEIMQPLKKPRVLVFGSRNWPSFDVIRADMHNLFGAIGSYVTVHGGAKGADSMADQFARNMGWDVEPHPAEWGVHGKAAGPLRNQEMVDSKLDYALGYCRNRSTGTLDMSLRLERERVPTKFTTMFITKDEGFPIF